MEKEKGFDYLQDGRFAYQPISEEYVQRSHSGQLIVNLDNGHLSVNKNGIIISITREIEEKLTDIQELKYDVDEQVDVIYNLLEDYLFFIKNNFTKLLNTHYDLYEKDKLFLSQMTYIKRTYDAMKQTITAIELWINRIKQANNYHTSLINTLSVKANEIKAAYTDLDSYVSSEAYDINNSTYYYKQLRSDFIASFDLS